MTASIAPTRGAMSSQNRIPRGYEVGNIQQYTPEQMQLFQQQFGHVSPESYLSRLAGGDESFFQQMEEPAHRQFAQSLGGIASRFSQGGGGQGALGARRSSGFQNTLGQAGSDFAQNLQAQRQSLQRQALSDLLGYSNMLLGQRPQEQFLTKQQMPAWQSLVAAGLPIAGAAIGGMTPLGPLGAALGGQIGASASQGFMGQGGGQFNFSGLGDLPTKWS
jgi:hypothetical protein